MPLQSGSSREVISKNIAELMRAYKRKGAIGNSRPQNKPEALKQAIAIAMKKAGKAKKMHRKR
ncbi:MAG: hypothetical protein K6U74_01405 [Firmicutes bacterium]|nr:hypothetical protein [Bacillota bacterium]